MAQYTATNANWALLSATVTNLLIQPRGDAEILFGAAVPNSTDAGFSLKSGEVSLFPASNLFGANAYIRFNMGVGGAVYQKS